MHASIVFSQGRDGAVNLDVCARVHSCYPFTFSIICTRLCTTGEEVREECQKNRARSKERTREKERAEMGDRT